MFAFTNINHPTAAHSLRELWTDAPLLEDFNMVYGMGR